jgi:tetratricopeptide (TPR) repeat protein
MSLAHETRGSSLQNQPMKPLQPPDSHHLSAAVGWLGLGRHIEANEELQKIAPENAAHPDVLEVLWHIHARTGQWQFCVEIAAAIIKLDPKRSFGWTHSSIALHELKRTQEAFDQLRPVAERFPNTWRIPYALACYCAQLERFMESQLWLRKAMAVDRESVKRTAITDPNLKPLWVSMMAKNVMRGLTVDPSLSARIASASHSSSHTLPSSR